MAFDAQGYRKAAMNAGIPKQVIENTIAEKTGVSGWLTGGKQGVQGFLSGVGNVLNLPSYAIGGAMNRLQQATGSNYAQGRSTGPTGIFEGIRNKRGVMTELPETVGLDPQSKAGMALGFAGELLTPDFTGNIGDLAKLARGGRALDIGSDLARVGAGVGDDLANTILQKSYKLNRTNIDKIAEAIGVEAFDPQKASKVVDYLESQGLSGATQGSMRKLSKTAEDLQDQYNALVRTGGTIDRNMYAEMLLKQADELELRQGDASSRMAVSRLRDEAKRQKAFAKQGVPMTDEYLTNTKTGYFQSAGNSIGNPYLSSADEQLGRASTNALEQYAPGSKALGKQLRGIRTAQEQIGNQANTGLGTQLFNMFKPSAAGASFGAASSYASGQNPIEGAVIGAGVGIAGNNSRIQNLVGKALKRSKLPSLPQSGTAGKLVKGAQKGANRSIPTSLRVSVQPLIQNQQGESGKYQKQNQKVIETTRGQQGSYQSNLNPYEEYRRKNNFSFLNR